MSNALNYLIQVRGDALGHYFAFLKDAGKHLDPKTRSLISVITKVHSQTEGGFRQYLRRALRDGCTPLEIVDALLMAFPALGLSKIVWATDIILDMDLPGFAPELIKGQPQWRDVLGVEDLAEGEGRRVACDTRNVFVYRQADGFKVYDALCPHQSTDMPQEALAGSILTCPKHGWKFDLRSGACIEKGDAPLKAYETRVEAGRVQAWW